MISSQRQIILNYEELCEELMVEFKDGWSLVLNILFLSSIDEHHPISFTCSLSNIANEEEPHRLDPLEMA